MSRGRCSFRESDVRRAVRAIEATGKEIAAVEISAEGKIRIVVGKPNPQQSAGGNEWDEVLANAEDTQVHLRRSPSLTARSISIFVGAASVLPSPVHTTRPNFWRRTGRYVTVGRLKQRSALN